ncbi:MAG: LssY C-terminal domain-containing protein [Desulfosarcina sp.]|nr:LssY C-terminal domain-containing protein [Desulfosarcina sp.]
MPKPMRAPAVCFLLCTILWGCATFNPQPLNEQPFRERAIAQTENDVRVSAAVLGAEETEAVFGLQLYKKGIQPVWLEIENNTQNRMWFPQVSVDRNYFSPLEVANMHHSGYAKAAKKRMDRYFHQHAIRNSIDPGTVRSGFVFTNLELGTKAFNVEVIGEDQQMRVFTFLIPVAGLKVDHREVDWTSLYAIHEKVAFDSSQAFRQAIEALPCCTTDADGDRLADPLNVVIVGRGADILYALLRSGWDETAAEPSYDPMAQLPWEFRYQPVKLLYLFNRPQDAAFRKSRSTLNERNQLRLWLSPFYYEGNNVWVGQISRIIRRAVWDKFIIEPDVDEARVYLLQDLWYAQAILKFGYVRTASIATLSEPRESLHDDNYFTDGLCLVVWVSSEPVSFSEVQFVPWEAPVAERRKLLLGR